MPSIGGDWWGCSVQLTLNIVCGILDRLDCMCVFWELCGPGAEAQFSHLLGALQSHWLLHGAQEPVVSGVNFAPTGSDGLPSAS